MIALFQRSDTGADIDDDARPLMAHDGREQAFGISARDGELVGVADAGGLDFHQHFASLRAFEINLDDFERFSGFKGDGGAGFHGFRSFKRLALPCASKA